MNIAKETIDDIRNSANIVEIIGHYLPLYKKGKNYNAVCPFHNDHDPSLSISVDKQIYKCFVCNNGGNCFTFVQNYKKCSFLEAVSEVADIIGKPLNVEFNIPKKEDKNKPYYNLLNDYIDYTNYILTATRLGQDAKEYLKKRGIEEEIVNEFQIGYNPSNNKVYTTLKAKDYSDEDMIKVGIARMGNNGMNDIFHDRITFPIHDKYGNPIAFTARDFTNFSDSKYINSQETLIYTKGNILYNHHRAKDSSRQLASVIVCEGVMDVIAYKRAGMSNVVATLGTACSDKQVELLKEMSKKVVLSYDGDKAGKKANMKIGEILLSQGVLVDVIDNDTGLDPDEIISKYDKNALRDLTSKRLPYLDYALKYYKEIYNLDNYNDRKEMTIKVTNLIEKLADRYDIENYKNELYELTKIRMQSSTPIIKQGEIKHYKELLLDGLTKAEYTILIMMALDVNAKDVYQKELGCLLDNNNNYLANLIIDEYRKNKKCSLSKLYDEVSDLNMKDLIVNLSSIDYLPDKYDIEVLRGAIKKVKDEIKKGKLEDLKSKINKFEAIDPVKTNEYLKEYTDLLRELKGK